MQQRIEWVIDYEELKAWEAGAEQIGQELHALLTRYSELLAKFTEIRDRGLSRSPGQGLRFAIITSDEGKELEKLAPAMESVTESIDALRNQMIAHLARFPRPKPRPRDA